MKFGYMNLSEFSSLFSIPKCVLKEIHLKMQHLKFCVHMYSTHIHLMVTHWPVLNHTLNLLGFPSRHT